jgi:dihydrofolate reductase
MRNVIVSEDLTLDGVMEAPERWAFPYHSDDMGEAIQAQMRAADAMLFGRVTYDAFAAYWSLQPAGSSIFADYLNATPKFVASRTLNTAAWTNTTLINAQVADRISALKRQPGGDIVLLGSAALAQSLIDDDLIDEYRLFVYPLVLGRGKRLFKAESERKGLRLIAATTFKSGVTLLRYQPAPRT